ncbi:uncharacterized protein F4822DRAFT_106950 [Hypoxylon trugodes]|uniref:uncharacterized protein n=1 Tax=Hypoxylon trugodes TaxID=326681 RepID=UPI0021981270|nr:uncharacterized protein F4822DRAFT_106950 [Hypoxylon trugodes]KAI1391838.1 hypothetical protein F4822DRAFT_106950 [Hypoxylon trugodes]
MPIKETFDFDADEYRQQVRGYSTAKLQHDETALTRKMLTGSVAVGAGVGGAYFTGGLTLLLSGYKTRSMYVSNQKHNIIQAELTRRNVGLHDIDAKDVAIGYTIGAAAAVVGAEIGDFTEAVTNTEAMGSHLPSGANESTGLTVDPKTALEGVGGQFDQLTEHLSGGNAADVAATVAASDATAYHAGMVQAQILEEHVGNEATEATLLALTTQPEKPSSGCRRSRIPIRALMCNECSHFMENGEHYWHCCRCGGDNYDICLKCGAKGVTCNDMSHRLKKYVVALVK